MAPAVTNVPKAERDFDLREIIEGVEYVAPSPFGFHQKILQKLLFAMHAYLEKNPVGEIYISPLDVILEEDNILQPDIIFLSKENLHLLSDWIRGVPDLVVEVVSKYSTTRDTVEKKAIYEKFGVKEYWIVFPDISVIEVFTLNDNKYTIHTASDVGDGKVISKILPDFEIKPDQIFK